jgi:hypothetical protein
MLQRPLEFTRRRVPRLESTALHHLQRDHRPENLRFQRRRLFWANNTPYFVDVWDNFGASGAKWTMLPFSSAPLIDRDYNDKASSLTCHA